MTIARSAFRGALVLMRHGQSTTNAAGQFTGWTDVPLTAHGQWQAREAGRRLAASGLVPDEVHTSLLSRAIRTADLLLTEAGLGGVPMRRSWRLNERHYGALTGRCKAEVRAQAGEGLYRAWRNSLNVAPPPMPDAELQLLRADPRYAGLPGGLIPAAESLGDVVTRLLPYWNDVLAPQLTAGGAVLVVAHGNSLRALISIIDRLTPERLADLRVPTGQPRCYRFDSDLRPAPAGGSRPDGYASTGSEERTCDL